MNNNHWLCHNGFLMLCSTILTFFLHRFHPEFMQILIDAGTFCGVVLLVMNKEK